MSLSVYWGNDKHVVLPNYIYTLIFIFFLFAEDILTDDKGECVICLEDLSQGDVIARLPCLCIYHKG